MKLSLSLFSALFLTSTTLLIIIYMKGYTIDFKRQTIIETGVLTVKTLPRKAKIFINGQLGGTSKKIFPALKIGDNYQIRTEKNKYRSYKQKVSIFHGLATIFDTQLIYSKLIERQKFLLTNPNPKIITGKKGDKTFVLTLQSEKESNAIFNNILTLKSYSYYNRVLGTPQITEKTIGTISIVSDQKLTWEDMTLLTNFDGSKLLISILDKTILVNPYLFDQNINWQNVKSLSINQHLFNGDKVLWENSTNYILIESKDQILTYNIDTQIKTVIYEKKKDTTLKYIYLEDQIAILESTKVEKGFKHNLISYPMSGGTALFTIPLINKILDSEVINEFWGDLETSVFTLSTNKGSFLWGDIFKRSSGLVINNNTEEISSHIVIQKIIVPEINRKMSLIQLTDTNIFDVQIMPTKHFVSFVTNGKKSIINRFIYNKEEPDLSTTLGKRVLYESSNHLKIIRWVNNGNYLAFIENKSLNYISPKGQNIYPLLTEKDPFNVVILPKDQFILLFKFIPLRKTSDVLKENNSISTDSAITLQIKFIELFE